MERGRIPSAMVGVEELEPRRLLAAELVVDFNQTATAADGIQFVYGPFDGKLMVAANDGIHGSQLWSYDPVEGPARLTDADGWGSPLGFTVLGDRAVFALATQAEGQELWVTDGTPGGTRLLKDIWPGPESSRPAVDFPLSTVGTPFVVYGGRAYFVAEAGSCPPELWVTDGTEAGTRPFADAVGGSPFGGFRTPVVMNGVLYFGANPDGGLELWRTDGTAAGTWRVKNFGAGGGMSGARPVMFGDALYFTAEDAAEGLELWKSDGTEAGTVRLTDIRPGTAGTSIRVLRVAGSYLYFSADDGAHGAEPWRTDGTAAGTIPLGDLVPGPAGSEPGGPVVMNDRTYFLARNGSDALDLWRTDGTPQTTTRVTTIPWSGSGSTPGVSAALGRMFFAHDDGVHGRELWSSDGTAAGTGLVHDLAPGLASGSGSAFEFNGERYFTGNDGVSGQELWRLIDTWAPVLWGQGFDARSGTAATATFNEDVTVDLSKLVVTDRSTGQVMPAGSVDAGYDAATRTLRVAVKGSGGARPADGHYRLTIPAGSVVDRAGNATSSALDVDFFVLAGDANHDGRVNFSDLAVLAQNYNQAGKTFAQGDFNGDGVVNFSDLAILAQRYNVTLPPPPAPVPAMAVASAEEAPLLGSEGKVTDLVRPVGKKVVAPAAKGVGRRFSVARVR